MVKILRTFKIWGFFFEIDKGGKFAVEYVSNGIISLKCLIRPTYEVFGQKKNRKFWKLEELENMMKCFFWEKKRFHLLKSLYKNGKAQNLPVVAGHLVFIMFSFFIVVDEVWVRTEQALRFFDL